MSVVSTAKVNIDIVVRMEVINVPNNKQGPQNAYLRNTNVSQAYN